MTLNHILVLGRKTFSIFRFTSEPKSEEISIQTSSRTRQPCEIQVT